MVIFFFSMSDRSECVELQRSALTESGGKHPATLQINFLR